MTQPSHQHLVQGSPLDRIPPDCRAHAEQLAGNPAQWRLRPAPPDRPVDLWHASGPQGAYAVRVGTGQGIHEVLRHTAVLQHGSGVQPFAYGDRATVWRAERTTTLITPWLEGPSTWDLFRSVRDRAPGRTGPRDAAVALAVAVNQLHQAGWVHADLQPHHSIHTLHGSASLTGCTWSTHHTLTHSPRFTTGLIHLAAPELLTQAAGPHHPVTTQPAEVYALAAGLWWAATGRWPHDYQAAGINPAPLTAGALRKARLECMIPLAPLTAWPDLAEVLTPVLISTPDRRPSALQLAQWLRELD
ncbi:phosphotransferase [Streptomyces tsukubensis]